MGKLVPFIGAGVSRLAGCPGWDELGTAALRFFVTRGELGHGELDLLSKLPSRVKLSIAQQLESKHRVRIDYKTLLSPSCESRQIGERVYASLSNLGKQIVVTTNYDEWLDGDRRQPSMPVALSEQPVVPSPPRMNVIYDRKDITVSCLDHPENTIVHIHGSLKQPETMVLTTRDYLDLYAGHRATTEPSDDVENPYLTFLERLFSRWQVLFIGYGLEELDILEYVLQKARPSARARARAQAPRHFILEGFFDYQAPLVDRLGTYYREECGVELLPFSREQGGRQQLADVIEHLCRKLDIGEQPALDRREDMENLLINPTPSKERAFVEQMAAGPEQEHWGYERLKDCPDRKRFFHLLQNAGMFSPSHNPKPEPGSRPGSFQIPYWPALDFLAARMANDPDLVAPLLEIVREVSLAREADGTIRDNYQTFRKFAEMLGNAPLDQIHEEHLDLIPLWLGSRFDRDAVTRALDEGLLGRLLASSAPNGWQKASVVLGHCTALRTQDGAPPKTGSQGVLIAADEYALGDLLRHHCKQLGAKVGQVSAEVLLDRVRSVFPSEMTWGLRPAVEDHVQNHPSDSVPDLLVRGARDILLAWATASPESLRPYARRLLHDPSEIVRRIAIHLMNEGREQLGDLPVDVVPALVADMDHLHELYGLLRQHYPFFEAGLKAAVQQAIRDIPRPDFPGGDLHLKDMQRTWLSAIKGNGEPEIDRWYDELSATPGLGMLAKHPDFFTWHETRVGPGPSPYTAEELVERARRRQLVEALNDFQETRDWDAPTIEALVGALEGAVNSQPAVFVPIIADFRGAKPAYQYGLIGGFKRAWESKKNEGVVWGDIWLSLIGLFESILQTPDLWTEPVAARHNFTPNARWIRSLIAEFIRSGSRADDQMSYPVDLLPRVWRIILELLGHAVTMDSPGADPQNRAINSEKGQALEALFSYSLMRARRAALNSSARSDCWDEVGPTFDAELDKCKDANFEFSVLAGEYISQMHYLAPGWLAANLPRLFPIEYPRNSECAISGLAYATLNLPVYRLLAAAGVFERIARLELPSEHTRVQLLEWIAIGYLWGEDHFVERTLPSLFESRRGEDLRHISHYFWRVRKNEELSEEQVKRVRVFWERSVAWAKEQIDQQQALGSLGRLAVFLSPANERGFRLLLDVAPFVYLDHGDMFIGEELERLVEEYPESVLDVLEAFLRDYTPSMDHGGHFRTVLARLIDLVPERRERLRRILDKLRDLPGMRELYVRLVGGN